MQFSSIVRHCQPRVTPVQQQASQGESRMHDNDIVIVRTSCSSSSSSSSQNSASSKGVTGPPSPTLVMTQPVMQPPTVLGRGGTDADVT